MWCPTGEIDAIPHPRPLAKIISIVLGYIANFFSTAKRDPDPVACPCLIRF